MQAPILIVTPTAGFGELILQTLEMAGYRPVLVRDADQAVERARKSSFSVAILDSDLTGTSLPELGEALRQILPGLRLIAIPPNDGSGAAPTPGFAPDRYLSKPFYVPDLLEMIENLLPATGKASTASSEKPAPSNQPDKAGTNGEGNQASPPSWLEDAAYAARQLNRLSLETSGQAALITRQGDLWAYAGQLPQEAGEELAQVVIQGWAQGVSRQSGSSDLARFVRLRAVEGEFMLYATSLGCDMVLALAFDADTPFSKMRTQAGHLARALSSTPCEEESLPGASSQKAAHAETTAPPARSPEPPFLPPDLVPPPSPDGPRPRRAAPAVEVQERPSEAAFFDVEEIDSAASFASMFELEPDSSLAVGAPADLQTAQPSSIEETQRPLDLIQPLEYQQLPSGLYLLSYACVLIPRLPQHHLTGNLPVRLADWVRQLSLSFGWRLETLTIRPDYLLWISQVAPNTSPGRLVKVMRRHTSQHIFYEFPLLAQDNPSGDFWASGYLAITTSQPPPPQVLKDFVAQTRRRQGVSGGSAV